MTDEERELQNRQINEDDDNLAQKKLDQQMKKFAEKRAAQRVHALMHRIHLSSIQIREQRVKIQRLQHILKVL